MANTTYGLQTLTFGVPVVSGYVTQTYDLGYSAANVVEVFNESGNRAVARYDDLTETLGFDAYIAGATLPVAGSVFTYGATKYEVLSVDKKGVNKDFTKVSIKGKKSEGITLP